MNRLFNSLGLVTALGVVLVANSAQAQWGHYRVTSSYSLPSVPYAFNPVVVPVVQPTTAFSPVIVNQPFAQSFAVPQPTIVAQPTIVHRPVAGPVVVGRPVVVGQPFAPSAVVVRRGLFRRPVVVTSAPASVFVPAPVPAIAAPVIVQRPIWIGP